LVTVTERGFKGLLKFSTEREDESVTKYLNGKLENNQITSVQIHEKYRKWYNNRKRMETNKNRLERKRATRRSIDEEFNWKENCCFCGNVCDIKRKYRDSWHLATTMGVGKNIKKYCTDRLREDSGDEWAQAVLARVGGCIDLVAAEARYHSSCNLRFSSTASSSKAVNPNRGRKKSEEISCCFEQACNWLEQDANLHTVTEVREKMAFAYGKDVSSTQYIKKLLEQRYKENISFASESGKSDIICFKHFAQFLINERFKEKATTIEEESLRIIKLAASLVKAEIRERYYEKETYPTSEKMKELNWNPFLLQAFLEVLIPSKLKQREYWVEHR